MRVLIATVGAGAGHLAAAAALEEAWREFRGSDTVKTVDVLDFSSSLYRRLYIETYAKTIEYAPELYAFAFRMTDHSHGVQKRLSLWRGFARRSNGFVRYVREFNPDVIVGTHYLPFEKIGHNDGPAPGPIRAAVVTDFG